MDRDQEEKTAQGRRKPGLSIGHLPNLFTILKNNGPLTTYEYVHVPLYLW